MIIEPPFMLRMSILFLALGSGCLAFDSDPPQHYVEGVAPDIYFTARLQAGTQQLAVLVHTAPLRDPVLEPAPDFTINLVTYSNFGDNYYDGSLGLTELRNPVQGDTRWTWSGTATMPDPAFPGGPTGARFLGIQIRGLSYEAIRSTPVHEYCVIEALGLGVGDCGEWLDAILQLAILCRGIVGEMIDCHGLGWAIVPRVMIGGIGRHDSWPGVPMADDQKGKPFKYFMVAGLLFKLDVDGWRYAEYTARTPRRGEPEPPPPDFHGPFRDPDEAARDFVATLGAKYEDLEFGSFTLAEVPMFDDDMQAMVRALDAARQHEE